VDGIHVDDLLLVVSIFVFVLETIGMLMLRKLRNDMFSAGLSLALVNIVFRFGAIVLFAQLMTVVNAALRLVDPPGTTDVRMLFFLGIQILFAIGFLMAAWEIHHLPDEDYPC
jgi:hypothetical protein